MVFTVANRATEVIFSFEGTNPPKGLLADLQRIGWIVPPPPPPPSSAIDWTPDPTAGTDYTLRPWRVKEFRLEGGDWPAPTEREIGALTIQMLKHHRVVITDVRGVTASEAAAVQAPAAPQPQAAAPAQPDQAATPQPQAATPAQPDQVANAAAPAATASGSNTGVILIFDPEPGGELPSFHTFTSVHGKKESSSTWYEGVLAQGVQMPSVSVLDKLSSRGGGAWHTNDDNRPKVGSGTIVLQMLAPDFSAHDPQLNELVKLIGRGAIVTPLAPLTGGKDAVLISTKISQYSVDALVANIRTRFPNLVFREE